MGASYFKSGDYNCICDRSGFKVKASDEDFALMLLSPMMQQFLVEKTNVTWHLNQGRVCLVYNGSLKFDRLEASVRRGVYC